MITLKVAARYLKAFELGPKELKLLRYILTNKVRWPDPKYRELDVQNYIQPWAEYYRLTEHGREALSGLKLTKKEQSMIDLLNKDDSDRNTKWRLHNSLLSKLSPEDAAKSMGVSVDEYKEMLRKHFK
jgi:hypothetical protein